MLRFYMPLLLYDSYVTLAVPNSASKRGKSFLPTIIKYRRDIECWALQYKHKQCLSSIPSSSLSSSLCLVLTLPYVLLLLLTTHEYITDFFCNISTKIGLAYTTISILCLSYSISKLIHTLNNLSLCLLYF